MKLSELMLTAKVYEEFTHREDVRKSGAYTLNDVKKEWAKTDKGIDLTHRILEVMRKARRV